jgi:hypothetical protein
MSTKPPAPIHDAARIVRSFKAVSSKVKTELTTALESITLQGQYAEDAELRDLGAARELLAALEKYNAIYQDNG